MRACSLILCRYIKATQEMARAYSNWPTEAWAIAKALTVRYARFRSWHAEEVQVSKLKS